MSLGSAAFIKKLASRHLLSDVTSSGVTQANNRKEAPAMGLCIF